MKFFIKRFLILLVVAYLCQLLLFWAFKELLDRRSEFRLSRYFRNPKHHMFVVGNSRAVNSVNEKYANEKLGKDIINLGFNGMPFQAMKALLDDINGNNTGTDIFVEVTSLLNNEADDSYAYYISNSKYFRQQYDKTVFEWVHLLRANNELFLRDIYYLTKSDNDWVNRYKISPALVTEIENAKSDTICPDLAALIEKVNLIKRECAQHKNNAIFFLAPYYPSYLSKLTDYSKIVNTMKSDKLGIEFYDLNSLNLPLTSFADRVHTNVEGANVLTEYLLDTRHPK